MAAIEARVAGLEDENLRLRDQQHQTERNLAAIERVVGNLATECAGYFKNADRNVEQIAYRVYNRIKKEERDTSNSLVTPGLVKLALGLVGVISVLLTLVQQGKL